MALITITSSFGSGGEEIARKVSEQLGTEFFDDRKLQEKALSMGVPETDVDGFDEKAPGLFDRLFTNKPAVYLDLLGSVVYEVARTGEGVIVGHGAQVFLKDFNCAFHVRIHASEATRGARLAEAEGVDERAAIRLVNKMDKQLKEFVQYAFKRDWNDPTGYDLMINLDKIGGEWAEKLIVDLAKSDQVKECSLKSLEEMEFSSLQRKVDAAIIKNNLSSPFIHVEVPEKGVVHLWGWMYNTEEKTKLFSVVKGVPGVSDVKSDIVLMPARGA